MRTKAKTDSNHADVIKAFRRLGYSVLSLHQIGKGCGDLLVAKAGKTAMIEVKDGSLPPSKRKLNIDQVLFHETWRGQIAVVESLDDVLKFANTGE